MQLVNETYDEYMKQMNILRNSMGEAAFHTLLDLLNMVMLSCWTKGQSSRYECETSYTAVSKCRGCPV